MSRTINTGGGSYHEDRRVIEGNKGNIIENQIAASEKPNLAEAAAEIQNLLEQLDKTYSADTDAGREAIATETIRRIKNDPSMMSRIFKALKAGSIAALEQALNHPAASFTVAALEEFQNSKGE
jgi:phosphoenolpyruvate-protein kinase (PTS system EI component)